MQVRKFVGCATWVIGCSSSSANSPADAMAPTGTTTGGGGGVASHATLSVYLTTFANAMPGVSCPPDPHWINVPFAASAGQKTTAAAKGMLAVDGMDQMGVTCSVKESSGVFNVSAALRSPAIDPASGSPVNPTLVALSTSIAAGQTANGILTVQDNKTVSSFSPANDAGLPDDTCAFSVAPLQPTDQLGVAPGRIWASVTCPKMRDPGSSNPSEMCAIGAGYVVLENCAQ